jgi:PemK-like, MazF-like toxin of type II toxin-antitoxin system
VPPSIPAPKQGYVTFASYLWADESDKGETEGRKDRPVYIIDVEDIAGETSVSVLPITHTPPGADRHAVEIPAATKERVGLDLERSWIVCDEANDFVWPGPDLRPHPRSGKFEALPMSANILRAVREQFEAARASQRFRAINRDL